MTKKNVPILISIRLSNETLEIYPVEDDGRNDSLLNTNDVGVAAFHDLQHREQQDGNNWLLDKVPGFSVFNFTSKTQSQIPF